MLVSIIVPFYNVEPYFRRCLDSIVNQSYRDLEIILVNDCSPDNSIAIAKEYASKDSRIKIIEHETNLRQGGARNSGLNMARGKYVWFIDSDDTITHPYAVEHLVHVAKRDDADIIIFNAIAIRTDGKMEPTYCFYPYDKEQVFNDQRSFFPVYSDVVMQGKREEGYFSAESCFRLFRLSFLRKTGFQFLEKTIHEDLPHLSLLPLATNVTILPYVYYNYFDSPNSAMRGTLPTNYLEHLERLLKQVDSIYTSLWIAKGLKKSPLTVLMLYHSLNHALRLFHMLKQESTKENVEKMLVTYYDLLAHYAKTLHSELENNRWPAVLKYEQQWRCLVESFNQPTPDTQKVKLILSLFHSASGKSNAAKKLLKMLLPYGVIRWMQIRKSKAGK